MLVYLADYLSQFHSGFNVFQYLTLRTILGALTALLISFLVGPWMIRHLSFRQIGQQVRTDGPETHFSKAGTPTMGGALILVAVAIATLLWADLTNRFVLLALTGSSSPGKPKHLSFCSSTVTRLSCATPFRSGDSTHSKLSNRSPRPLAKNVCTWPA